MVDLAAYSAVHARDTVLRFRLQLAEHPSGSEIEKFLRSLPTHFSTVEGLHVHGSPRNPLHEFLYPEDIYNPLKMEKIASHFDASCFCGHTHVPGIFHRDDSGDWQYISPEECHHEFSIGGGKLICNVGSVGQPRDSDPRACYVLLTPDKITFRRVEYDIERTIYKMRYQGDDGFCCQRLIQGR